MKLLLCLLFLFLENLIYNVVWVYVIDKNCCVYLVKYLKYFLFLYSIVLMLLCKLKEKNKKDWQGYVCSDKILIVCECNSICILLVLNEKGRILEN